MSEQSKQVIADFFAVCEIIRNRLAEYDLARKLGSEWNAFTRIEEVEAASIQAIQPRCPNCAHLTSHHNLHGCTVRICNDERRAVVDCPCRTPIWDAGPRLALISDEQRIVDYVATLEIQAENRAPTKGEVEMKNVVHETVPVQVWIDVDVGVADVVRQLQGIEGIRTHASCQGTIGEGGAEPYPAYVMVSWNDDAALSRLDQEFEVEIKGEGWGYIHPLKP